MVLFLSIPKNNFLSVIPKYCRLPYGIRTCAIFLLLNMGGSCDIVEVFRVKKRPTALRTMVNNKNIHKSFHDFMGILCGASVHKRFYRPFWKIKKQQRRHTKLDAGTAADGCGGGTWTSRPPGYEPDELPNCSTPRYYKILWCRKPGLNRYDTFVSRDFKSRASANSAIPAIIDDRSDIPLGSHLILYHI